MNQHEGSPSTIPPGMGAAEDDGVFPRTIRHFSGVTTVERRPERLVVLATGQFDAALSLGVIPVGATVKKGAPGPLPGYLRERFPQHEAALAQVIAAGGRAPVDLAAVADAKPDLIVGTSSGAHGKVVRELGEIAPTVLTGGGGFGWKRDFLLLAEALGERAEAQRVMRAYGEHVERLRTAFRASAPGEVSFVRFGPEGVEHYGLRSFAGSIATDLGLPRPRTQRFDATSQRVEPAETGVVDGDRLFYAVFPDPASRRFYEEFAEPWSRLRGRVVEVPPEPWFGNAGPTAARVILHDLEAALLTT